MPVISLLAALALTQSAPAPEPDPQTLYHQAVGCAASAVVAQEAERAVDDRRPNEEVFTWGMAMAQFGPLAGRTVQQVDHEDFDRAKVFFSQMRETKPAAFAAHRSYCGSFLP
jgi:hypothetical protein